MDHVTIMDGVKLGLGMAIGGAAGALILAVPMTVLMVRLAGWLARKASSP